MGVKFSLLRGLRLNPSSPVIWGLLIAIGLSLSLGSCTSRSTLPEARSVNPDKLQVVAAENVWGSIASQLGGDRVEVTSIIANPAIDPHDYEPKPTDARLVARAQYLILNGVGYDAWATKLVSANPQNQTKVLDLGTLAGRKAGENPHLWYNPDFVMRAIGQITADYKQLDPSNAAYFDQQRNHYQTIDLKDYTTTIAAIRQQYSGTPVGATESIFADLAPALGLKLITAPSFMNAISAGTAPTAADKALFDQQITQKQIKLLIYNTQNSTPDVEALKQKARVAGIPQVAVTETPIPANASFQDWQTTQLKALQQALAQAQTRSAHDRFRSNQLPLTVSPKFSPKF